ncbi:MAG: DNA replication complex GINS family protein [Candidatus Aenigmarchaeota archaeon]|nr:DNA replication complex GINS family protein [Candidatus Aenigmarchaeota archaeon]
MADDQKEIVITYETLYEILRREKSRDTLQKLDDKFFDDVLVYLKEKQKTYEDVMSKNDMFSVAERDSIAVQLANIRRILKELYDRRERKIIDISLNKARTGSDIVDTTNMLPSEQLFFDAVLGLLSKFRQNVLNNVVEGKKPDVEVQNKKKSAKTVKHVKFLENVQQLVGEEMELYGPFMRDDKADLPKTIADILIGKGSAAEVEVE